MKRSTPLPSSPLGTTIGEYVNHKRALGRRYQTEAGVLRLLEGYLLEQGITKIEMVTRELLEGFVASRPCHQPRGYNHLLIVLGGLFNWLVRQGVLAQSPVPLDLRRPGHQRQPSILNREQLRHLLQAAGQLTDGRNMANRGATYEMIFALLGGLGLRVGEVRRLCLKDVDWERQLLIIREAKFYKTRLVPFGPKMAERLKQYLALCRLSRKDFGPESPLFSAFKHVPLSSSAIGQAFRDLLNQIPGKWSDGARPPSVHCLRHSFAVGTLLSWYREGLDPGRRLHQLSTFLGHVSPLSTSVYLTITTELLQTAADRFERLACPVQKEV